MTIMPDDSNPFDLDWTASTSGVWRRARCGYHAVESRASRRARPGVERSPSRTARADAAV